MAQQIEGGEKFIPNERIHYAKVAVVSKTISKKQAGNVTLFAFAAGEGLAEHGSPHEALVMVVDGSAEISIGGKATTLTVGECLLLPATIPHALQAVEAFKMMLVMIKT